MTLNKLKKLITQGESEILEFKKSTSQLPETFQTVSAFLNGKGGHVLIGVTNEGKIIGQNITDRTRQEIASHFAKLEPSAQSQVEIKYIAVEKNKSAIKIATKKGSHVPYTYDGRAFLRNQSTTTRMPQHRYEQLIVERGQLNHSWEEFVADGYSLDDLDEELILRVVRLAVDGRRLSENALRDTPIEILKKFNLLRDGQLIRAAIILFCKNEAKQFIQSQLRLARFKGINKNEFIDSKLFVGNAFYLYEQAMMFLNNYLPIAGKFSDTSPVRIDTPAIPYKVLREAVINAIAHRDYAIKGGAISLAIYDDRVEVSSAGTLPVGISINDLTIKHRSVLRNPFIAKVLYACGYIEMWGRGTQTITELCAEAGNPKPEFQTTSGDFTICLPLKAPIASGARDQIVVEQPTIRQQEILALLNSGKMLKSTEILAGLSLKPDIRTIRTDLLKLQRDGLIEMIGKGRSTVWKLRK